MESAYVEDHGYPKHERLHLTPIPGPLQARVWGELLNLLVGYHGEPKVNLFHDTRIV